jgi:outer membrane protein assembly factor BamB
MLSDRRQFLAASLAGLTVPIIPPAKALWTVDLQSPSYGGGAIGDLNGELAIVFGTYYNDEHLYALRANDGKVLWKFKSFGGPLDASVAIADIDGDGKNEVLSADSSTGDLFCLDGNGRLLWKHQLPNSTDSPMSIADMNGDGRPEIVIGTMTTPDRHGRVVCWDPRDRRELWSTKIPGHVQSEPVLFDVNADGQLDVLVTNWRGDKHIFALHGRDGSVLWKQAMKGDMYHGPAAFDHQGPRIFINSIAGDMALLDGAGKPLWTKQIAGEYLFAPPAVADVNHDGQPEIVVCGAQVHVFDLAGRELWKSANHRSIPRGVAVAQVNRQVVLAFGANDRRFRMVEAGTGQVLLDFDAKVKGHVYEGIDSGPVIADFDRDGQLEAFFVVGKGTSDNTKAQNYGRAVALKLGPGTTNWPTFRGNLLRTGYQKIAPNP